LSPFAFGGAAGLGVVGGEVFEVLFAVGVADFGDLFFGDCGGDISCVINGVEVGDDGDGDPVEVIDLVVAADDYAELAVVAGAELGGGVGADVVEVNSRMASGVYSTEGAVGLFHEEGDRGVGGCREAEEDCGEDFGGAHGGLDAVCGEVVWNGKIARKYGGFDGEGHGGHGVILR